MESFSISKKVGCENGEEEEGTLSTLDGTVDLHGRPALKAKTGRWTAGAIILVNQGLATLAFFGVGVNLVLYLTRVLQQGNAEAANNVSKWTGTVYIFSLVGAFLSDSYWGRYKTCAIFQAIFVLGLGGLSIASSMFLITPKGCGDRTTTCGTHSSWEIGLFYVSIYMIALGYGGYQPNIATFGADQFDEEDAKEGHSKVAFFSYFYLALNLGSLFSNTFLSYFEDEGMWTLGFWLSTGSAFLGLALFLVGTVRYRHFKPSGNPLNRFCQVFVAASKKWTVKLPQGEECLFEDDKDSSLTTGRKILHTHEFKFLDKAAFITSRDFNDPKQGTHNPWTLCPISQVEEVKCILRLLPIWLCTIIYSVVFTQMASLFVEQGAAMKSTISSFQIPASSMSSFDILSVALFIFLYRRVILCCLPKTLRANKLINLEMPFSKITEFWEGGERKVFDKLKFIDFSYSKMRTIDLTVTPHLKELDLEGCYDLVDFHLLVEYPNLKILTLCCSKEGNLDLRMTPNLEKLNLHACDEFELHMPIECPKLIELKLKGSQVSTLNLGLTPNLQRLYLEDCNCLKEIHAPVGCLKKLVYFRLACYASFVHFRFDKQHESSNLHSVAIFKKYAMSKDICPLHPENDLPQFGFDCEYDEPRSSWSGNIEKLISFGLCACKNLEDLSAAICGLQYLRELKLIGSIPRDLWQLQSLEKSDIKFCPSLQDIPNSICNLKCLRRLDLYRCDQVEKLPEELGCRLECLEELGLNQCSSLQDIPNSICSLKCLRRLKISCCCQLEKLPEELGCLECLEELELSCCGSLQDIPNSICNLICLRRLNISSCYQVEKLPEELGCLECLEELVLNYCSSLHDIPNSICSLKCLRRLDLSGCDQVEKLPEELGCLECLEKLLLNDCNSLQDIPNSICSLKCLRRLDLSYCYQIERLPEELGCLECLEWLSLWSCKSLRHIPNSICNLKCLEHLYLSKCVQVEKLPEELGCLEYLKVLDILGAGITRLPQSIYQSKGLQIIGSREQLQSYDFTSLTAGVSTCRNCYYAQV